MKFYREHWYYIGGILFVALAFLMGLYQPDFSPLRVIMIYSFMSVLVHQWEEYVWPGGFPSTYNLAARERELTDRYPMNANMALIINVFIAYPFYLLPIIFPNWIWLGIATVLGSMYQLIVHGVVFNIKLKSIYNPGLATVLFLYCPIGIYYCWYVVHHNLATTGDFVIGFIVSILFTLFSIIIPIRLMRTKETKYPFAEARLYGTLKEKMMKIKKS